MFVTSLIVASFGSEGGPRVSPLWSFCPFCGVKPGHACKTAAGGKLDMVNVARIKEAAVIDAEKIKRRRR